MNTIRRIVSNSRFILGKPMLVLRVLRNYLLLLSGKKVLKGVSIALDYRCQSRCAHCSCSRLIDKRRKLLNPDEIKNIIDQSLRLGAVQINFTGGEAMLRKEIFDIISDIPKRKCLITLNSNAFLLDMQNLVRLKNSGLDILMVSLDGSEKSHDKFRRTKGSYHKVINCIKAARKIGIKVVVCTVATKENLANGELESIFKLIRSLDAVPFVNMPVPVGGWSAKRVLLSEYEKKHAYYLIDKYEVRRDLDGNYLKRGCPAGSECIYVSAYGDVLPCDFIHVSFGNLKNIPLEQIWKKMLETEYFSKIQKNCLPSEDPYFINQVIKPINKKEGVMHFSNHPFFRIKKSK